MHFSCIIPSSSKTYESNSSAPGQFITSHHITWSLHVFWVEIRRKIYPNSKKSFNIIKSIPDLISSKVHVKKLFWLRKVASCVTAERILLEHTRDSLSLTSHSSEHKHKVACTPTPTHTHTHAQSSSTAQSLFSVTRKPRFPFKNETKKQVLGSIQVVRWMVVARKSLYYWQASSA